MFNILHTLISKTPDSTIPMQKGTLTNVLTCFLILHKKVHLLQTKTKFLTGQLMSFNDDTNEQENKPKEQENKLGLLIVSCCLFLLMNSL